MEVSTKFRITERKRKMRGKCPICGAPMENHRCGYCGYEERNTEQSVIEEKERLDREELLHQEVTFTKKQEQFQQTAEGKGINRSDFIPGVSRKNKTTALLLCIFLGAFGAHKFYVGKLGIGLLYLFTGGLFGIGWVIDIILVACGSFTDEFGLPLR